MFAMDVQEGGSSAVSDSVTEPLKNVTISDDEKAVYDRQIRLWGLEAQNRLCNSNILIAGMSGCGAEVAKNLTLAGIKSITLLDHRQVSEIDECSQFLIAPGTIGKNRAEASRALCHVLNPHVNLRIEASDIALKPDEYFEQFDLVILIDCKYSTVAKINNICRVAKIRFIAGGVFGWTGYGFFDFNNHTFLLKAPKPIATTTLDEDVLNDGPSPAKKRHAYTVDVDSTTDYVSIDITEDDERVQKVIPFSSWEDTLNVDWTQKRLIRKSKRILPTCYFPIRALLRAYDSGDEVTSEMVLKLWKEELVNCNHSFELQPLEESDVTFFLGPSFGPTCGIVGAVIGQEAINALSQTNQPLKNLFMYSALETAGVMCNFPPVV